MAKPEPKKQKEVAPPEPNPPPQTEEKKAATVKPAQVAEKPKVLIHKEFYYGKYCDESLWIGKTVKIKIATKEKSKDDQEAPQFWVAKVVEIVKGSQPHKIKWKDNNKTECLNLREIWSYMYGQVLYLLHENEDD